MGTNELHLSARVDEAAETVWSAVSDWSRQGEWMLGTEVHVLSGDGGLGSRVAAFTGLGGVGFLDTMEVVEWRPPRCCRVRHLGGLIRGEGGFQVVAAERGRSLLLWWERLELPPGGSLAWPAARPAFVWGLRRSLTRFAAFSRRYRAST